ncbi:MAG TPA: uroporphyrinogen-III C-methyltransferase [Castellaniella sp.]|uniref:uroporphyrinogen-III C-methyltransferase n=1 Tax=Castellaniella sp. TaxID=1955812 RepID=UPI002F1D35D3
MTDTAHSPSDSSAESTPVSSGSRKTSSASRRGTVTMIVGLIVLALILAGALYYQQQQYRVLRADLIRQHGDSVRLVQESQSQASQALALAKQQASQIDDLQRTLETTGNQVQDLEQALQMMTDSGSDLMLLNDIDRLVTIAQQQLGLGGNVANAIVSLEAAQAQLARANRPSLAALQQTLNGDLDRLRAVATINVPALSGRLEQLSGLVATAPLLVPDAAAQPVPNPAPAESPVAGTNQSSNVSAKGWRAAAADAWAWTSDGASAIAHDLRGLFDIRRVGDTAALLMSPDQALRFREGLKQRIVTAQLALMMHQPKIWQAELDKVAQAVDHRYDMHAESSRQALKIARELHDTAIEIQLPTVDNTLQAISAAREAAEADDASPGQGGDGGDSTSDQPASPSPAVSPATSSAGKV